MTTRTKRRGRRSLAAILAAMLMASVLAVVAGSPAQAANTSGEYLVDHDNDANTAAVREFAGRDRYDTSLKLAKRFADDRGGIGSVANAFLASGESLVDAVSVSGLAGFMDAPVLLTPSSNLHRGVADFIEDYGISNIYVLGGTAAISDGVVDALGALAGVNPPTRIAGDTRYDTSAAIAANLAGESWCGTNANSAIVVSGANEALFDAVAIGPVANRLELPVLLTAGDELVDAVLSYIETEDVEHVVIVGGTGSVSEAVADALSTAGVDTVERIGGDSAAATAVAIAEVIGDACAEDLSPISGDTVALVNRDSLADGISAAPVLSDDNDQLGGGLIPILAVGDTLPASVRDYLAATPEEDGVGNKIHMRVLAVGGTAAVSDSVVSAAVSAASSAASLTVVIGTADLDDANPDTDENHYAVDGKTPVLRAGSERLTLYFSDDVGATAVGELRNRLEDILQVNDIPADIESDTDDDAVCDPDSVTVRLASGLNAGDKVSIVSASIRVGAAEDRRTVEPTSVTVPADPVDRQRPSVQIVAIIGHTQVYAVIRDNSGLAEDGLLAATVPANDTDPANEEDPFDELFERTAGVSTVTIATATRNTDFAEGDKSAVVTIALTGGARVAAADRYRANRGAVEDEDANESQVTTGVPVRPVSKLSVSGVQMSNLKHTARAYNVVPTAYTGNDAPIRTDNSPTNPVADNPAVWLRAKVGGAADGAYGNGWQVRADRHTNWDGDKAVDIDVFVSTKDRRIVVRIVNGRPKFADLKAELEGHATVNALFDVLVDNAPGMCTAANNPLQISDLNVTDDPAAEPGTTTDPDDTVTLLGGVTTATVRVNFNGYVEEITDPMADVLMTKVLEDTLDRYDNVITTANQEALRTALNIAETALEKGPAAGPVRSVDFVITTVGEGATAAAAALTLPRPRDIVDVKNGFTVTVANDVTTRAANAAELVANGYGDTVLADGTEPDQDDWNYASKVRIATSSSVPVP